MPISLTCSCGAKLEFDDKFAGQTIACPDCNKPLVAERPMPPTRTSGLAVLSLLLALVGAFTVVGTLAAIACGAVAARQLSRKRNSPVGGLRIAQAGIILGVIFTVVSVAAYGSRWVIGLDSLARQFVWAGKVKYPPGPLTINKKGRFDDGYTIVRPSALWGIVETSISRQDGEHLMLVNLRDDSFILWLSVPAINDDDDADRRNRVLEFFRTSEMVKMIGRMPENATGVFKERGMEEVQGNQEFFLDLPVNGIPRTIQFSVRKRGDRYVNALICVARAHRFAALATVFREAMDSFNQEK